MTDYTWVGTSADASTASNWSPSSGIPNTSSDTAIFANDRACTWNIATVGTIQIKDTYTGMLTINNAVAITGLVIDAAGKIDAAAGRILTFSGTPPYNSGKTHIVHGYSTDDSPFRTETARGHITYKMNGSSAITYDSGIYPHILLTNGSHTPDYAMVSGTRTNQIKFHSLTVNSGATFAPASATPSANDRLRKWISETAVASQFAISSGVASFNGGYAEWTFQAISSGFPIPTSGVATYNQCKFTFDKMVIDASVAGVGKWAQIIAPSRLILTDFTVNVGASVKGSSSSTGCAILLVNKPKIHGTWSFLPVADGYYVYPKTGETLGYPSGGTGLNSLGSANQVLATNAGATAMEWQTVSAGSGDIEGITTASNSGLAGGATTGTPSLSLDINNLAAEDIASGDMIAFNDAGDNGIHKESIDDIATLFAGTGLAASSAVLSVDLNEVGAITPAVDDNIILTDTDAANATKKAPVGDVVVAGLAGAPVSILANDAEYLTAATTPTGTFCQWNDIGADITASGVGSNTLINNWTYTTGSTAIRDAMSSGVWTCTAPLAGTYLIISKIQFKSGTLSETAGVNYKLQNLNYWNAGGGTPSSGTLSNFARHMNADFYIGYILETQFILTIADTDTFGVYAKIATSSGSGNFKIASGSNAMTSLTMIKIA